MIRFYPGEKFEELKLGSTAKARNRYAISNIGRIISFRDEMVEGKLLKTTIVNGYRYLNLKSLRPRFSFYVHKIMGQVWLENDKPEEKIFVIHKDFDKLNNNISNLKWATKKEMLDHYENNPNVKKARQNAFGRHRYKGHKLTETDVRRIKKKIFDPNRKTRLKMIAKQFGISEMQLYRIKSGENWGHIKV